MSINYSCIVSRGDKILLAEYPSGGSNWMRVNNLLTKFYSGTSSGQIDIENDLVVNYIRTVHIILVSISKKINDNHKEKVFLQDIINAIKTEYESIENLLKNVNVTKLCFQKKIGPVLQKYMSEYQSENREDETFDRNDFSKENINNEPLLKNNVTFETQTSPPNRNKCNSKCIIFTFLSIILILAIVYTVVSFLRCGNFIITC
jgi:hypothetical protein